MRFWNWTKPATENATRELHLEGVIAQESWWDDEVSPKQFRDDLYAESGDVTVWINSPGGDVFAAAQIYNMLKEYEGNVTVKIDGLAASAASVIAMAGDTVLVSPVANIMIHNPSTMAWGEASDLQKAIETLASVKESIINAYKAKTGLQHKKLADMMDAETWLDAKKAVELGFADKVLYADDKSITTDLKPGCIYARADMAEVIRRKLTTDKPQAEGTDISIFDKRLSLLSH